MTEKKLTDEELKKVSGGIRIDGDDNFGEITNVLTECGNIAWSIEPWNGLWRAINEAEKTDSKSTRSVKINDALKIIGSYEAQLGIQYNYLLEKLQYCLTETNK